MQVGADLLSAEPLRANTGLASLGATLIGSGFIIDDLERQNLLHLEPSAALIIRPYMSGRDLTSGGRGLYTIDAHGLEERKFVEEHPRLYQHLHATVLPQRQTNARKSYRDRWWIYGEPRSDLRAALAGLNRFVITARTAKHRMFAFTDITTLAESRLVAFALTDASALAVLSSRFHSVWSIAWGAKQGVGNDLNYNIGECFDPFPFPADVSRSLMDRIRAEAEALDALRKHVLAEHVDLTLTKLYNVLEALREGRTLTPQERDIHDRGLVTLIRQHHDAIDEGVADAYGWGDEHRAGTLDEETILTRLVALNKERAAEEARGLVRYLRPEFQDPGYRAPVAGTLDLGEAAVAAVSNVIAWPATLPEQVGAVQSILAAAPVPLAAGDIARSFKGKRAATVRPVLDALAGLGMARRLNDGRYAA